MSILLSCLPVPKSKRLIPATTIAEYVASVCRTCDDTTQHVQILVATVSEVKNGKQLAADVPVLFGRQGGPSSDNR